MDGRWCVWMVPSRRVFQGGVAGLALSAVLLSGWMSAALAQSGTRARPTSYSRDEEQQWLDDLSNAKMEEYRSRSDRNGRSSAPVGTLNSPTAEMKKIRPLLGEFSQESSLLKTTLSDDQSQNSSIRGMLIDAYNLAAQAVVMSRSAQKENDHLVLMNDLQDMDAAWGELSYRLSGTRNLSRETLAHVKSMNEIATDLRQALDYGQQFNRRDLSTKAVSLATDLENLMEDITIDLGKSQEARVYSSSTSKAHQQVMDIADLADSGSDLQAIVEAYKKFQEDWYPQAAKLQSKNREYLARSLRRIAQSDGEISRLLLMPERFDKTQVVYLANALRKDIDDFSNNVTLKKLLTISKSNQALATADEFYGVCDNFIDTVNHETDYEHIVDAFRQIEAADRDFLKAFNVINDDQSASSLSQISQTLDALRSTIQVNREDFDRPSASSLAAKIENLADHIDYTSRTWLSHDRQSFSRECQQETDSLLQSATKLHSEIVNGANVATIQKDTENLYQSWRRVYNYLIKCQTEERQALGRSASQLTPALVELRTLVAH